MSEIIDDFSKHMNPPVEPIFTQADKDMLSKVREIVSRGKSAEIKGSKDGNYVVYEVVKMKR